MRCISTNEYVCDKCGHRTHKKPSCFPICPACGIEKTYTSDNTWSIPPKWKLDPDDMRGL